MMVDMVNFTGYLLKRKILRDNKLCAHPETVVEIKKMTSPSLQLSSKGVLATNSEVTTSLGRE